MSEKANVNFVRNMLTDMDMSQSEVAKMASTEGMPIDRHKVGRVIMGGYVSQKPKDAIITVLQGLYRQYEPPVPPDYLTL
jgi:hypothetical protein